MLVSGLSAIFMALSSQTNVFIENIRLVQFQEFPDKPAFKLTLPLKKIFKDLIDLRIFFAKKLVLNMNSSDWACDWHNEFNFRPKSGRLAFIKLQKSN